MKKPFTVRDFTVIKNLNCGIKQTNFETSCERIEQDTYIFNIIQPFPEIDLIPKPVHF